MGAEFRGEIDVSRLVEASDEIARLEHGAQHRRRLARIGAQLAVAQVMRREKWRASRHIEQQVATRGQTVAGSLESEGVARGGARHRIIVDGEFERAEMTPGVADSSLDDREQCRG